MYDKDRSWNWVVFVTIVAVGLLAIFVGYKIFKPDEIKIPEELIKKQAVLEQQKLDLEKKIAEYRREVDSLTAANEAERLSWNTERVKLLAEIKRKYDEKRKHNDNLNSDEQFLLFSEWIGPAVPKKGSN